MDALIYLVVVISVVCCILFGTAAAIENLMKGK